MAAQGAGLVAPDADWASLDRVVEPDATHRGLYDELYAAYTSLHPATREHQHLLADLQSGPGS